MAFDPAPSTWLGAGYSLGTNQAIFNTSTHGTPCLASCSSTNANATTGDIRTIVFAFCNKIYKSWVATASADRPARMTVTRNSSEDSGGHLVRDFSFRFYLSDSDAETLIAE